MIDESDYGNEDRVRYNNEMNLEFWGLAFTTSPSSLSWVNGGLLALKSATTLGAAAVTIATATLAF